MANTLSAEQLEELTRPRAWRSWLAIAREWLVIVTAFWLVAHAPHWHAWRWPVWIACFVLLGRQNYTLLQLTHEAGHWHLFRSKTLNDIVGQWLCSAPATFNMYFFRKFHSMHHLAPLSGQDGDLRLITGYPISKASFRRKMARDLIGRTNWKGHIQVGFNYLRQSEPSWSLYYQYGSIIVVQALMLMAFFLAGHPAEYFFFWLLPAATVGLFLFRVCIISQHAGMTASDDQALCTRTVINVWQNFWIAPYNAGYHIEHHLFPKAPFHNLPRLHELLLENGSLSAKNVYRGYGAVMKEIVR